MANLDVNFESTILPIELKKQLEANLKNLIAFNYDGYLNLVYRVDVSERELLSVKTGDSEELISLIAFLILKRECQKVWIKRNYKDL